LLQAYADGVNRGRKRAFEEGDHQFYLRHNVRPKKWRAMDSLLLAFLQSLDQTKATFTEDSWGEEMLERFGEMAYRLLSLEGMPKSLANRHICLDNASIDLRSGAFLSSA